MSRAEYSSLRDHCGYFIVKAWKVEEPERNVAEELLPQQKPSLEEAGNSGAEPLLDDQEIYQSDEENESVENCHFSVEDEKKEDVESGACARRESASASVIRGTGTIAGFLNEKSGVIWWHLKPNHFQSVLFTTKDIENADVSDQNVSEILNKGTTQ